MSDITPETGSPEAGLLGAEGFGTVQDLYQQANEEIISEVVRRTQIGESKIEIRRYIDETLEEVIRERDLRAVNSGLSVFSEAESNELRGLFTQLLGAGKLEAWLNIHGAENVYIFGSGKVVVKYASGESQDFETTLQDDDELIETIRFLASSRSRTSRRFDTAAPILDLHLPPSHRLFAVMAVSQEPYVVIRYHSKEELSLEKLAEFNTLTPEMVGFLRAAILPPRPVNMLIGGGTSTGKTTTLRSFLAEVPKEEILVTIEDTLELQLRQSGFHENCFELETRAANVEGVGEISMYDLSKAALRMAPDRVIVGEVRGGEIMQLLNAMGQGNDGSIGTIHADSSKAVISRILTYSQRSDDAPTPDFVLRQVGQTLDLIIFISLLPGQLRKVTSIREVLGYAKGEVYTSEIFGVDQNNETVYLHAPHPKGKLLQKLRASNYDIADMGTPVRDYDVAYPQDTDEQEIEERAAEKSAETKKHKVTS